MLCRGTRFPFFLRHLTILPSNLPPRSCASLPAGPGDHPGTFQPAAPVLLIAEPDTCCMCLQVETRDGPLKLNMTNPPLQLLNPANQRKETGKGILSLRFLPCQGTWPCSEKKDPWKGLGKYSRGLEVPMQSFAVGWLKRNAIPQTRN